VPTWWSKALVRVILWAEVSWIGVTSECMGDETTVLLWNRSHSNQQVRV
jgi:hypothetical protein